MISFVFDQLIDKIISSVKIKDEARNIEDELYKYSSHLYDKLRLTKNVIFRNRPIDFNENYIPLNLISSGEIINSENILQVLENYKKIIILGSAGSGKTTLLKHIAIDLFENGIGFPIFLELRNFNEEKTNFDEFVYKSISDKVRINKLFENGKFVFIFDGFDEINYVKGKDVIAQIERFISKNSNNKFIFSSRPGTNIESLSQFYVYEIKPLNNEDISLFIRRMELPNQIRKDIFYHLENDHGFYKYLTNPLFLSLYINYINYHSVNSIPSKKSVFFRNILDTLFSQHDSVSKLGFVRDKLSGLNRDQLENVASILAFRAFVSSNNSFSTDTLYNELNLIRKTTSYDFENENIIYDLTITVNILVNDSGYYSFAHLVLLEYLSSIFVARLNYDQKEKIYSKFIQTNKLFYSSTFLTFLYELDYRNFCQYFIIPFIDKYINSDNNLRDYSTDEVIYFLSSMYNKNSFHNRELRYMDKTSLIVIRDKIVEDINNNDEDNIDNLLNFI